MKQKKWFARLCLVGVLLFLVYYISRPMRPPESIILRSKEYHIAGILAEYLKKHETFPDKDTLLKLLPEKSVNLLRGKSVTLFYFPEGFVGDDKNKWHLIFVHKKPKILILFKMYPENLNGKDKAVYENKKIDYADYPSWLLKYRGEELF